MKIFESQDTSANRLSEFTSHPRFRLTTNVACLVAPAARVLRDAVCCRTSLTNATSSTMDIASTRPGRHADALVLSRERDRSDRFLGIREVLSLRARSATIDGEAVVLCAYGSHFDAIIDSVKPIFTK